MIGTCQQKRFALSGRKVPPNSKHQIHRAGSEALLLTASTASLILADVNEYEKQQQKPVDDLPKGAPLIAENPYPASIEKMSERWREIQQEEHQAQQEQRSFVEKNYLAVGLGIALLVIALLVVIGGFAFLIWRAQ